MFRPGMGGGFGGAQMQNLMRQAQKMQEELMQQNNKADVELENAKLVSVSGGGMVEVAVNGKCKVLSVKIKPEVVDPEDIEMLEDLVLAATNDAIEKAKEMEKQLKPQIPGM